MAAQNTYSIQNATAVSTCTMEECPICYDYMVGPENLVVTECGHQFHCACLMQSVVTNGVGCPMCRQKMVAAAQNGQDEDEDEEDGAVMTIDDWRAEWEEAEDDPDPDPNDVNDVYTTRGDTIYVNDVRDVPEVRENFMLRGFQWLFEQQSQSETEKSSIEEDDLNEILHEKDWHSFATREQALKERTKTLINDTKIIVPYEQLMRAYLFVTQPEIYHSSSNVQTNDKIRDKMSSQISRLDLEFNWTRMDDILESNLLDLDLDQTRPDQNR